MICTYNRPYDYNIIIVRELNDDLKSETVFEFVYIVYYFLGRKKIKTTSKKKKTTTKPKGVRHDRSERDPYART
jgi:hypothetical protein